VIGGAGRPRLARRHVVSAALCPKVCEARRPRLKTLWVELRPLVGVSLLKLKENRKMEFILKTYV